MAEQARKIWTLDEFFAWQEKQDDRYELVDGEPLRMQSGVSGAHVQVATNILIQLGTQLRDKKCRPFYGDWSVQTKPGQIRRPYVLVDCGMFDPKAYKADKPVLVCEVLSPTTRDFDTYRKAEEYKLIASLRRILLVDPNRAEIFVWSRADGGEWEYSTLEGLEALVEMTEIEVVIPMAEIYRGISLHVELRLVGQDQP